MYKEKIFSYIIIVIFVAAISFLLFTYKTDQNNQTHDIQYVTLGTQKIKVELAVTPEAQERGLSGRVGLSSNTGMLFIFSRSGEYNFWMKDMNFAIDIIWISSEGRVVYIKKNAQPDKFPETYGPNENAKYILEVTSGFSEKNNIKVGDSVKFDY